MMSIYDSGLKILGGVALTFELTLRNLEPGLVVLPIREESYITLSYCLRKDQPLAPAIRAFSDYVYANVDVIEKRCLAEPVISTVFRKCYSKFEIT